MIHPSGCLMAWAANILAENDFFSLGTRWDAAPATIFSSRACRFGVLPAACYFPFTTRYSLLLLARFHDCCFHYCCFGACLPYDFFSWSGHQQSWGVLANRNCSALIPPQEWETVAVSPGQIVNMSENVTVVLNCFGVRRYNTDDVLQVMHIYRYITILKSSIQCNGNFCILLEVHEDLFISFDG